MDANSHPIKVQEVKDAKFFANTHPYKVKIVGGGGQTGGVTSGYYYNGKFFEDEQYTKEITPQKDGLYLDKSSSKLYTYNGAQFIAISGGTGSVVTWRTW